MSQALIEDFLLDPYKLSGIALTDAINRVNGSLRTTSSGSARPEWAQPGTLWVDTSVTPAVLKLFDGTSDYPIGKAAPNTLAANFNPAAAYFSGETVSGPDGLIYQAKGPIVPGVWDATQWTNISTNILNSLKTEARSGPGQTSLGRRNRIINGDCQIQQLPAIVCGNNQGGFGGPDRYQASNTGAGGQFTQSASTIVYQGVTYPCIKQTVNTPPTDITSNKYWFGIQQLIEGINAFDLIGQPVATSFLFQATLAGTYAICLRDSASANSYIGLFNYAQGGVPQRIVVPAPPVPSGASIPNTSGIGFQFCIGFMNTGQFQAIEANANKWIPGNYLTVPSCVKWSATAGNYISLTNLQIEAGPEATPFERVFYDEQLERCYRYLIRFPQGVFVGIGSVQSNNLVYITVSSAPRFRRSPTVIGMSNMKFYGVGGVAPNNISLLNTYWSTSALGFALNQTGTTLVAGDSVAWYTESGPLDLLAEI